MSEFAIIRTSARLNEKDEKLGKTPLKFYTEFLKERVFDSIKYKSSAEDFIGRFYGEFMSYSGGDGQSLGIILTPAHICELFCDLLDVQPTDIVLDPCCGTAGFLVAAMHRMDYAAGDDQTVRKNIRKKQLHGFELQSNMFAIACTNMILREDGNSNIQCQDFLKQNPALVQQKSETIGAVLLISHDRYFMDHVCDRMCELLLGATECYDGNYSAYMVQRTERFEIRMKAYELQQKEIARQEAIIARYRQFNREKSIRLAESREKRLEKVERLEKPKDESAIHFHFDVRRRTGDDVLMIDDLAKGFSGRTLFEHVKMHLRAGDRVALIGDNGVGKSTLFKCIVGEEKPDCGTIRFGAGVDIGYYDQHQAHLHENKTVLDEVWDDFHRLDQTEVRGALGLFLFTGDDVLMPISTLSGGEKGRVALTKLMLKKDNVLLLDEPTNHLDMDSREVLEDALENFPGTILAISHDRYFINRFATKVCVLEAGGVKEYLGNYDDYFEKINRQQAPDSENAGMTKTAMDKEKRKSREEEKRIREKKNAIAAAEKAIATAEEEAAEMEAQLADPATYQDAEKAAQLAKAYQLKKDEIERRYAEWEALSAEE